MPQTDPGLAPGLDALFEISNDLLDDGDALRARMEESGYLFFRALIPAESILEARREILTRCAENGWLAAGIDADVGTAAPGGLRLVPTRDFRIAFETI